MLETGYTVGRAAGLSGVTVRTLHHYEQIGLVVPGGRSSSGYRLYSDSDLDRLRLVLYYRELGFALPDIASILDDRSSSLVSHLRRQRELLQQKVKRTQDVLAAVDRELEAYSMNINLTPEEKLEIFGKGYDPAWEDEAKERWGDTEAWKQSQQSAAGRTKQDWEAIKADTDALMAALGDAKRRGVDPTGDEGAALAERHRASIEVFYSCSYAQQRGLADLYLSDERFRKTYEDVEPGLAQWVHDAINANADRHGAPGAAEAQW